MSRHHDLFERCKRGEPKAQRMLYDLFKGKLMGLCRRYTRDREQAQDVLQDTFVKIFTNLNQLSSPEKLETWMKTTAVHTAINQYHRTRKHDMIFTPVSENERHEGQGLYENIQNLSDEYLLTLINELPDGCRMVFNLFAIEGYSHAEIAAMMKTTEGTSRSQFHHAKQLLKKKLKCQDLTHYYEKLA